MRLLETIASMAGNVRLRLAPARPRAVSTALYALQHDVLEAVVAGQTLADVANLLCRRIEQLAPGLACAILGPEGLSRSLDGTAMGLPACWSSPILGGDGAVVGMLAVFAPTGHLPTNAERTIVAACVDLCRLAIERDAVLTRLALAHQRLDVTLSNLSQGVCFFDAQRKLVFANQRYLEIYRLSPEDVVPGRSLEDIVGLRAAAGSGPVMGLDAYLIWRDGMRVTVQPTDSTVDLADGRVVTIHHRPTIDGGWVATHEDITERRRDEQQIVFLARHDALTGLPNRVLFHERLEQALALSRRGQESCLMCIDLDAFKAVNDNFGHPIGDALLKAVASRLLACVREVDTVTRLGGDEFAILLSSPNPIGDIADLAERIIGRLSEPFILEGHRVGIGASMGIAVTPDNGITAEVLLKSADTALCRGKQDRPGTFRFFQPAMHERLQARLQLERDLAAALQADEFNLLYQPIVDLATNRISGFEALLRWHHATRGLVQPAEFIPLAEETGLIVAIGAWVLRRACVDAATWPEPVTVAVNLSVAQLRSSDLVATVRQALADAAIPANRLELEITESVLIGQCRETLDSLHAVRNLGVSFALDDFGTGYSSLSTLHSFPFDRIKIDRSFIRDLTERADSAAIIRAVVGLGHGMGIATVAEGIEYQDQLLQVRQEGCTQAQGFLFSPPISCADAVQMLRSFQPAQLPAVWRSPLKLT